MFRTRFGLVALTLGLLLFSSEVQGSIIQQAPHVVQVDTGLTATVRSSPVQVSATDRDTESTAGNGASRTGKAEGILVAQILLLLILGRVLGEGMQRIGQPALMGMLLSGIILGPSLLGWAWPEAQHFIFPDSEMQKGMIDGISQVGILLLLLLTGMETDLKLVRKSGFAAAMIALCGIAFPFACGYLLGEHGPAAIFGSTKGSSLATSLFLGTALSISSIKIVAMVVREMNFMRRNLGQIIVATAIMEDTAGWVIIAIIIGITDAQALGGAAGPFNLIGLAETVGGVALFLAFSFTVGRWLVYAAIRWANDHFRSEFPVITMILVIMGAFAIITELLGVRTVLGAFMAGVLIGGSPILTKHIENQLRGMIMAFFMPIFFGMSGLSADLTILKDPRLAGYTVLLVAIASLGKFSGAFAGARLGRLTWREGIALGCAMNARGSTEVIVASIGLSMGVLTQDLYTMIITMAVLTTMAMPPMLRAALSRLPMSAEEKTRIEREALDREGFLPQIERLLIAVDASATGRRAARIAGLLAGAQGMSVTILELDDVAREEEEGARVREEEGARVREEKGARVREEEGTREEEEELEEEEEAHRPDHTTQDRWKESERKAMTGADSRVQRVKELKADPLAMEVFAGARKSAAKVIADDSEPDPDKIQLTARVPVDAPEEVIKDEARKGYGLMLVGLDGAVQKDGTFAPKITGLSNGFDGPLMLFSSSAEALLPLGRHTRLLLPTNGSPQSRRAAEVAFSLARATGAQVQAMYASQAKRRSSMRLREERVLKDLAELGERYNVNVVSNISPRGNAPEAILKEAKRNHDFIVMGVSARPGEELYFGTTATKVLQHWDKPILFLVS